MKVLPGSVQSPQTDLTAKWLKWVVQTLTDGDEGKNQHEVTQRVSWKPCDKPSIRLGENQSKVVQW